MEEKEGVAGLGVPATRCLFNLGRILRRQMWVKFIWTRSLFLVAQLYQPSTQDIHTGTVRPTDQLPIPSSRRVISIRSFLRAHYSAPLEVLSVAIDRVTKCTLPQFRTLDSWEVFRISMQPKNSLPHLHFVAQSTNSAMRATASLQSQLVHLH